MVASIFKNYVGKYLGAFAKKITEKINGKPEEIVYEHKKYLKKDFSPDMRFSSLSTNNAIVAADVVALDSPLPLKKRGSMKEAVGEVPKLGMKKAMNETMLQQLQNMESRGGRQAEIVKKLFQDGVDIVKGIYERLDIMFLQALSTGITLIDENNNTGTGIRIDFGIPNENRFGVTGKWTETTATPISDIENVTTKARNAGYVLRHLWMDKATFNLFKANEQVKKAFAGYLKIDSNYLFRVSREDIANYLNEEFGLALIVIDKVVQIEKGGTRTGIEPWERGNVVFTTSTDLGTVTWSELAEKNHPVKDVEYATVDDFILWSMFRTNDPLKENTSVQALAVPVLDNVDSIFIMDTDEATAAADSQTESDAVYTYKTVDYTKASVVAGINAARAVDTQVAQATISQLDATLAKKIDSLSEAGIALFEAELIENV